MPVAVRKKKSEDLPLEERIRSRAYELYVERGDAGGSELGDWLQAEDEILAQQDRNIEEGE
jgi:Protein of unknown function (DUF2934)